MKAYDYMTTGENRLTVGQGEIFKDSTKNIQRVAISVASHCEHFEHCK